MTTVAICIATYQRNDGLRRLLESINQLECAGATVVVIVVDNDPRGRGEPVVHAFRQQLRNLSYAHERQVGIPAARNRLVALASAMDADFLAFVDDDEWVSKDWLTGLLSAQAEYDADVVVGRVMFEYEDATPAWRRVFRDRHFPTGSDVPWPGTGNTLVSRRLLSSSEEPFATRFPRGSDTLFFMNARRSGARFVFAGEAVVWEWIPRSRTSVAATLRRTYTYAVAMSCFREVLGLPLRSRADRIARCLARVGLGVVLLPLVMIRGRSALLRSAQMIVGGVGGLQGLKWRRHSRPRPSDS